MTVCIPMWAALAVLALAGCAIAAGLFLFLSLQRQIRTLRSSLRTLREELDSQRAGENARLATLEARFRAGEERAAVLVPPSPPRSGLNLNKRIQVLRMARQGDRPREIAAALLLPRAEVELLLKVEQAAADRPGHSTLQGATI